MKRRTPRIPQRTPIFVGCEGESEAAYVSLLDQLAQDAGLPVHIHIERLNPGTGDPLARVERAVTRLAILRRTRAPFAHRFILLDDDQVALDRERADRARRLAQDNDIELVWQSPCHEALLLRHLEGCETHRPPDSRGAGRALEREWQGYRKPLTRVQLGQRIDLAAVYRAAQVEPGLAELLRGIGLTGFDD